MPQDPNTMQAPQETQAPAPTQSAPPVQESQGPSLRDTFRDEFGFDTQSWKDDREVVNVFRHLRDEVLPQYQQYATYGQQYLQNREGFDDYQKNRSDYQKWRQQQQAVAKAQAEAEKKPWWPEAPEWDPINEAKLVQAADGTIMVRPGEDPGLVGRYHAFQKWQRDRLQSLLKNPVDATWDGIQERLDKYLEQKGFMTQETWQDHQERQYAEEFRAANQDWLYQIDKNTGQPALDRSGQPILTPQGQYFAQQVMQAQQDGIADPRSQVQWALQATHSWAQQWAQYYAQLAEYQQQMAAYQQANGNGQQQQQQASGGPDPRERFLAGTGHSPNRSGSMSTSAMPQPAQNSGLSYRDALMNAAVQQGVIPRS